MERVGAHERYCSENRIADKSSTMCSASLLVVSGSASARSQLHSFMGLATKHTKKKLNKVEEIHDCKHFLKQGSL